MVAEGPLLAPVAGSDGPLEDELGRGGDAVAGSGAGDDVERPAHQQRREQALIHPLRQGRNGGQGQGGRAAQDHAHRQRLAEVGRGLEVEAAAFLDLPMHAGAGRVETLQPVDAEVAHPGARVAGMDERQGEEGAAVERPTGQARQFVQARRAEALCEHGATADLAQAGLRQAPQRPAGRPQRGHGRR